MRSSQTEKKVVDVPFRPAGDDVAFEVIPLQALFARKLGHSLEEDAQRLDFYVCLIITRGCGTHIVDFVPYSYEPGSIFFISKYQIHSFQVNRQCEGFLFVFTEQFVNDDRTGVNLLSVLRIFDSLISSPKLSAEPSQARELQDLVHQIVEEYGKPPDPVRASILRNLFLAFILKAERVLQWESDVPESSTDDALFREFRESLEHHHCEFHNVQDYARLLGWTPKGLNTLVKRITGKTAKRLVDERIVLEAKRMLSLGDNAQEVAFALGFTDPTYFVKYFKRHTGQTPKAFQATAPRSTPTTRA